MTFSTTNLVNHRVLVRGTDSFGTEGSTIVDSMQWDELADRQRFSDAQEDFDQAVDEFFAPLLAAAEAMHKSIEKPTLESIDYLVLQEQVDPTPGKEGRIVKLTKDSVILRLIEQGDTDRLVWVDGGLEVLETLPGTGAATPAATHGEPAQG